MIGSIECIPVGALATNCWIYTVDGDTTVLDPGGDAGAIIQSLKSSGKTPARILLTHGHFDHIQALPELHDMFPDAPVMLHRADCDYVNENGFKRQCFDFKTAVNDDAFVRAYWRTMPDDLVPLDEGAAAIPSFAAASGAPTSSGAVWPR